MTASVACGPPSAPPASVSTGRIEDAPGTPQTLIVRFFVNDAESHATVAAGSVLAELRDGPSEGAVFAPPVCGGRADVPVSAFQENVNWLAEVRVDLSPTCPPQPPNVHRELTLTFTPAGGAALPVARYLPNAREVSLIADPWVPSQGRPTPTPPEPPLPEPTPPEPTPSIADASGLRIGIWPVEVVAPGATTGPDPSPLPTAPDAQVVANATCSVTIMRYPSTLVGGSSIRGRLVADGNALSVDDVSAAGWRLEYEGSRGMGINYGFTAGGFTYTCGNTYAAAERRACGSAICSTFRAVN